MATPTAREKKVSRILGKQKRIYLGWERRDKVRVGERILNGYVKVVKQNSRQIEATIHNGVAVEGYNWMWLARRNSISFGGYVAPEEFTGMEMVCKTRIY